MDLLISPKIPSRCLRTFRRKGISLTTSTGAMNHPTTRFWKHSNSEFYEADRHKSTFCTSDPIYRRSPSGEGALSGGPRAWFPYEVGLFDGPRGLPPWVPVGEVPWGGKPSGLNGKLLRDPCPASGDCPL